MGKVLKEIELSENTLVALQELATITGAKRGLGELIQDALRVYEWLIYYQLTGYKVVPLTADELNNLNLSGERETLASLVEPGAEDNARKYFSEAA